MEDPRVVIAVATAGPVLGSLVGILLPAGRGLLCRMLAFAAGTMLAISFLELLSEAVGSCGAPAAVAGLAVGLCAMLLLDDLVPQLSAARGEGSSLRRTALLLLAAITLHNFPEGLAMAAGSAAGAGNTALLIAAAIAAHDIPEGVCTAAPYYAATGRRFRAFLLSASTALPTVAGYVAGRWLFRALDPFLMGFVTAATAGLMIYISCAELLPAARGDRRPRRTMAALFAGVMLVVLMGALIGGAA